MNHPLLVAAQDDGLFAHPRRVEVAGIRNQAFMFRAIEIEGEPYWDGGFAGNPTITPLVRESDAQDTILIQINPRERRNTPKSAGDILDRLNEISFNAPLMKELRMASRLAGASISGPCNIISLT